MTKKRIEKLKGICEERKESERELSDKLLSFYKGTRGKCYDDFLRAFPNIEGKRRKADKELKEFGVDFSVADGYFEVETILHLIKLIEEDD